MSTRRSFLSRAGFAAAALGGAPHISRSAESLIAAPGQKPGRIIQIVSDGMSMGTLTCANQLSLQTRKKGLSWLEVQKNPASHLGLMNTRSLNSPVTDSSAASSAWGSGSRVVNGTLNKLPNGTTLTPLYTLYKQKSWARGLVSSAEITHATPAGFAAAVDSRGDGFGIAAQYFDQRVEVLLGGARPHFDARTRKDKRDLKGEFASAGYAVVQDKAGLAAAALDKPLLGTFAEGHLPYAIDHRRDEKLLASTPSLAELTLAALTRLERHENFILQVEGARIDHAAHNSDAPAALFDQIALDEAIDHCLAFQKRHPDTLIVITTDHGNSNLGLNGMGSSYKNCAQHFAFVSEVKASYPEILKRIEKAGKRTNVPAPEPYGEDTLGSKEPSKWTGAVQMATSLEVAPADIQAILADATGYKISERRAKLYARVLANDYSALYDQMNGAVTQLGQLMANRLGIGWTGNTHTSDYVPVLALGPGAERFRGVIDNTDVFRAYTDLTGIDHRNPSAPLLAHHDAGDVENAAQYARA